MRWALQVKLAQNWDKFGELLLLTGDRPIVEHSRRDPFWGAKPVDDETLVGTNALGRLLMELRKSVQDGSLKKPFTVKPLPIPNFLLYGNPIEATEPFDIPVPSYVKSIQESPPTNDYSADVLTHALNGQIESTKSMIPLEDYTIKSSIVNTASDPLSHKCRTCGAEPGKKCKTRQTGKPAKMHAPRRRI